CAGVCTRGNRRKTASLRELSGIESFLSEGLAGRARAQSIMPDRETIASVGPRAAGPIRPYRVPCVLNGWAPPSATRGVRGEVACASFDPSRPSHARQLADAPAA